MTCAICGCGPLRDFRYKNDRLMTICVECRHVTWQEIPTDEELDEYYRREYTTTHNQLERQKEVRDYYVTHVQELERFTGKPACELTIVDTGCSYPIFLECAKEAGAACLGVDWSVEAREYGQSVGISVLTPPEFLETVEPRSVDVLRYSHCLEHLIDPLATLRRHLPKLKPGGTVYVTQPNFPVFKPAACDIDLLDSNWPGHLHFFNPISLAAMFERCGVVMRRLFSVSDEVEAEKKYRDAIDVVYAARRLEAFAALGEPGRGPLNNYPYYTGFNVGAFGVLEERPR